MYVLNQNKEAILDTSKIIAISEGVTDKNGMSSVVAIYDNNCNYVLGKYNKKEIKFVINGMYKALANNAKSYVMPISRK